jgi:hypothetical protein
MGRFRGLGFFFFLYLETGVMFGMFEDIFSLLFCVLLCFGIEISVGIYLPSTRYVWEPYLYEYVENVRSVI